MTNKEWCDWYPSHPPETRTAAHGQSDITVAREPRPAVPEETLASAKIQIERKMIFLALKENVRGRFLRISEQAGDRRNSIVIPSTGLKEFYQLVEAMVQANHEKPFPTDPSTP